MHINCQVLLSLFHVIHSKTRTSICLCSFHDEVPKDYRQVSLTAVKQRFEDERYEEIGKEKVGQLFVSFAEAGRPEQSYHVAGCTKLHIRGSGFYLQVFGSENNQVKLWLLNFPCWDCNCRVENMQEELTRIACFQKNKDKIAVSWQRESLGVILTDPLFFR